MLAFLLLDLQGRDEETQVSCPNGHTLVIGQGCDHRRVCSIWAGLRPSTVPSQTEEGQVARQAQWLLLHLGMKEKNAWVYPHHILLFCLWGLGLGPSWVHIHTWHV